LGKRFVYSLNLCRCRRRHCGEFVRALLRSIRELCQQVGVDAFFLRLFEIVVVFFKGFRLLFDTINQARYTQLSFFFEVRKQLALPLNAGECRGIRIIIGGLELVHFCSQALN